MVDPEPLDDELALASHWVVMPCKYCGSSRSSTGSAPLTGLNHTPLEHEDCCPYCGDFIDDAIKVTCRNCGQKDSMTRLESHEYVDLKLWKCDECRVKPPDPEDEGIVLKETE
jgi:hypothetical protein